jgi:hydroxyacyl-ACP dehydratase HTD2-like protein with hotdog domain
MQLTDLNIDDALPEREHTPTNVSLFLYNAAVWNAHRIHYDEPYTTTVEQHPRVVIDGPLQGDWLAQCVTNWMGDDGTLEQFQYSNRRATYLGETLQSGGRVTAIDAVTKQVSVELWIKNKDGEVTSPGAATVRLDG